MDQEELVDKTKREHISKWMGLKDGNVVVNGVYGLPSAKSPDQIIVLTITKGR